MSEEQFMYQPGVCNIDATGVRWRNRLAYSALIGGVLSMAALYYFHYGFFFRVIIGFGFGYSTALNFFQAKEHFCVMNAAKRTYESHLVKTKITDDLDKDLDKKKMRGMIIKSLLFAALGGCLGLLPF